MGSRPRPGALLVLLLGSIALAAAGCEWRNYLYSRGSATPLGTLSDPVWQNQEANAEASDFVIHEHEFASQTEFLNTAGEDHVKQIAARLVAGQDAPVIVERSRTSARPETQYKYPVNTNTDLDMLRREVVVRALTAMRVPDADARVVVAPDLAPTYRAGERAATYFDQGDDDWDGRGNWGGWGGW